jgi:hyperosmotically inducible periplasmic protein
MPAGGKKMLKQLMLAALALAVFVAPASGQIQERKNLQILNDVASEVQKYTRFTIFDDVSASVDNGVVTLSGKVTAPFKKDDLSARVSRIEGVHGVRNEIGVLPVSPFDDDLRYRIARAIYGHSNFWHYAAMANPPIHIVVEGGRVTLTGVVNSNVERMLARSLATTFGAFSVKNELKTDAEVQQQLEKIS